MSESENKDINLPTEVENEKKKAEVDKEETANGMETTESKESGGAGEPVATMETDSQDSSKEEDGKEVQKDTPKKKVEKEDTPKKKKDKEETPKKKKEKEDDEDDSDGDWEEPPPGLLERPVLMEGKRERKKVERIDVSIKQSPKEEFKIPEGKGEKCGDIPRIEFKLGKTLADDLKPVHRILYGRVGVTTQVKRNIRQFCGFDFSEDSPEYKKKLQMLNGFTLTLLKYVCDILDVEKTGTKENITTRIMDFLMKPKSSGKKVPEKKRKRSVDKKEKKKKSTTKSKKPAAKKESPKKSKKSKEEVESSESEEESEEESDDSSSEEEEEEEEEEVKKPPKKKTKKEQPKKTPPKKTPAKKKAATPKKTAVSSDSVSSDDDSDDDEPLAAKKEEKKPPTDAELKAVVKKVLEGANLEEVTMKTVCRMVYEKYPGMDLTHRKDFIKTTVKEIIR